MKKFLVILLAIVLTLGTCTVLGGCADTKKELIVFTMFGGDDGNNPAYSVGVEAWKKANPGVELNDQSIQAVGEGFDSVTTSKFVNEKYAPDVLYVFSPGRNLPIQPRLATVAEIREIYPDYGAGFPEVGGDPHALAFLGNSFGLYYEKSKFAEEDFASYSALRDKLKTFDIGDLVDATGEMNTWFNYIGLQKMGKAWADVQVPDAAWLTENKTALIGVLEEMLAYCKTDLGMGANATISYGDEKQRMWNGEKVFDPNGNWNAAGFYPPHSAANKANLYDFRSFVIDDNPATTDIDESKYVMSGFFHGWMISKKCLNNPDTLKLAVDFINKQCENVLEYGGMAANGAIKTDDTDLAKATKAILTAPDAIMCSPIDDKWMNNNAKKVFYDGLKNLMLGTSGLTPSSLIDDTIAAF